MNTQPSSIPQLRTPCRALSAALGFLLSIAAAWAQPAATGSIAGQVSDSATGTPLSGAIVRIESLNMETSSDREGDFSFSSVPVGAQNVNVSYLGLPVKDFPVNVVAGTRAVVQAKLGEETIMLEAMTISGQKAGQARALNEQRASDNLKNIVSSDALGRFPDQNAAESLQRISGVSLERDQGEGRFVVIRGIDPDLNNTQMNGISLPASESDTRKVNLDVIPSDLIESVEVTKATTPDMDADAIGGSVNLKTLNAFSQSGRVLRGSAEGQYNKLVDKWGHRVSVNYGDVFNDGKFGVMLSLSDQKRKLGSDNYETGDPWVVNEDSGLFLPGGDHEQREYIIRRARQGASLSLDFRPTTQDSFYVRGVYNHFSDYEYRHATVLSGNGEETDPTESGFITPVPGSRGLAGSVFDGGLGVTLKDREEDNNIWAISAGGEHKRGRLTIDYVGSLALAEIRDVGGFEAEFEGPDSDFTYDYRDVENPRYGGAFRSAAASDFELDEIALENSTAVEKETAFSINAKIDTQFAGNPGHLKFGLKHRAKEKDVDTNTRLYSDDSGGAFTLANVARQSPRGITPTFPSIDGPSIRSYFARNPVNFEFEEDDSIIASTAEDFITKENISSAYAMASVDLSRLTLLGGFRAEHTDFKTSGFEIEDEDPSSIRALSASRKYTNVLPSLHVRFDFTPRLVSRASWTQTIARPKFPDSAFRREIDDDGNYIEGNPNLSPYKSDNLDLSLEFYPKSLGVISAALFRKDIDDFIFRQNFSGAAPTGEDLIVPQNGRSAVINGLELTWQQQLSNLPSPFNGIGLYANATLTDSEADLGAARPGQKVRFAKQSDEIMNYAISYEKHGFFIRLAANYRSEYLDEFGEEPNEDILVDERWQLDLSTNYRISDRFTVYAEFLNITDEPFTARWGVSNRIAQAEFYNFSANVGVKFSF